MKTFVSGLCWVAVLSIATPGLSADATEAKELDGKWTVQLLEEQGHALSEAHLADMSVEFSESVMCHTRAKKDYKLKVRIDKSVQPYRIEFIDMENPRRIHSKGIFELNGDVLRICWGYPEAERPAMYVSTEENGCCLMMLKRGK